MNKWGELLGKCGFKEEYWSRACAYDWRYPDGSYPHRKLPPANLDNIFKFVVIKVPVLDRPALLTRWVWRMYVPEVDGDPVNDLIDILYEAII